MPLFCGPGPVSWVLRTSGSRRWTADAEPTCVAVVGGVRSRSRWRCRRRRRSGRTGRPPCRGSRSGRSGPGRARRSADPVGKRDCVVGGGDPADPVDRLGRAAPGDQLVVQGRQRSVELVAGERVRQLRRARTPRSGRRRRGTCSIRWNRSRRYETAARTAAAPGAARARRTGRRDPAATTPGAELDRGAVAFADGPQAHHEASSPGAEAASGPGAAPSRGCRWRRPRRRTPA